MQLEEGGVDVNMPKETAMTRNFIGRMEDWEKEKHQKNNTVVRALFINKCKDLLYHLPALRENDVDRVYFIQEDDIVWCRERGGGWTIFGQRKDPDIEEDKLTPFLVVTLLCDTVQTEGVRVQRLEIVSYDKEMYDLYENNL